jgi:hypothetical protein
MQVFAVLDLGAALERVQLCDAQRFSREIDAGHGGATLRHRLGQHAAAASDVENLASFQRGKACDPLEAHRIDVVQRPHRTLRIPPACGKVTELAQFCLIDVHGANVTSRAPCAFS